MTDFRLIQLISLDFSELIDRSLSPWNPQYLAQNARLRNLSFPFSN